MIRNKYFFYTYLLVMSKYWGKNYLAHRSFPEGCQKQKTEKKERGERERLKVGNNKGQLCISNATSGGARKPPGQTLRGGTAHPNILPSCANIVFCDLQLNI